jgi:hypothetical protein
MRLAGGGGVSRSEGGPLANDRFRAVVEEEETTAAVGAGGGEGGGRGGGVGGGGGMRARESMRYDENDAGGSLGGDVKALRFFASTLARMQAPGHQERPWNALTQQARSARGHVCVCVCVCVYV